MADTVLLANSDHGIRYTRT